MEIEHFDLKLQDLPKEVEIKTTTSLNADELASMVDDLKGQILYNSRNDGASEEKTLSVEILNKTSDSVTLKIS